MSGTPDGAALVYNPVDGLIYMTNVQVFYWGGAHAVVPGTWTWNGAAWSRVSDSNPGLYGITYDSGRGKLVGYGDSDTWNLLGTYEWSGSSWDEITTATRVPIRFDAVFAYHPVRHKTVLIGGVVGSIIDLVPYNDIWEYDGNDWSEVSPSVAPERNDSGYSVDTARGKLVIFGGSYGENFMVNETWTY